MTNGNLMPGYRQELGAGEMDSRKRIQYGRGGACRKMDSSKRTKYGRFEDCHETGPSLMSLLSFVLLAIAVVLPQCSASDPCSDSVDVSDKWRDVSVTDGSKTDNCDKNQFDPDMWYSFSLSGKPAAIPTTCIKNNMCGSKVAMRVDLLGQNLPQNKGDNITASLCGSYDVLGKFDCCVLRSVVNIVRCPDETLVYNFPNSFDRCPVAVCTQEQNVEVSPEAVARMGEDVSPIDVPHEPDAAQRDFNSTDPEVDTVTYSNSATTVGLDETSDNQLPQELKVQQTTELDLTGPTQDEVITFNPAEEPRENASNNTANATHDFERESQTDGVTPDLQTDSNTELTSDITELIPIIHDLYTNTPDASQNTLLNDTSTQPVESSETTVRGNETMSLEITSETTTYSSSSTELLSTTSETTSDPTITAETFTDESLSATTQTLLDFNSTTAAVASSGNNSTSGNFKDETIFQNMTEKVSTDDSVYVQTTEDEARTDDSVYVQTTEDETRKDDSVYVKTTEDDARTDVTTETLQATGSTATHVKLTTKLDLFVDTTTTRAKLNETPRPPRRLFVQGSVTLIEEIRLVFKGDPSTVASTATVCDLFSNFLDEINHKDKASGVPNWTYQLTNISDAVDYDGRKTYMDFKLKRSANAVIEGSIFGQHSLKSYLAEHANLTLLAECHNIEHCQNDPPEPVTEASTNAVAQASVFESNAPAFITVIVLVSICLLVLVLFLLYSHFSKRGSWEATSDADIPENRHYISGNHSPFADAQIMKDEMVDDLSVNGSAKDGDTNLHSTWVIPLDQDPDMPKTVVAITTEDTKF